MTRDQVETLLAEIAAKKGLDSFVVMGSLSVYGITEDPVPEDMTLSNEVDSYPEVSPELAPELAKDWGQGTEFERTHGYYFDPISPALPTLPDGWEARLLVHQMPAGVSIKYAEPNDVAISKYARGEPKDRQWIRAGLEASILSMATMVYRMRETPFLDQAEHDRVSAAIEEDQTWLESRQRSR